MRCLFLIVMLCFSPLIACAQDTALTVTQLPDGRTTGELSLTWWQWLTDAPDVTDPLADESGDFCGYGQQGDVWFLSGSYSTDKVVRKCKVPAGKYIFFPVINMMMWDGEDGLSCEALKKDVTAAMNTARNLVVTIDGRKLDNLKQYRDTREQCFAIPGDDDHYASDGYWVLLKPLSPGKHVVHFRAQIGDGGETVEDFGQDMEYVLEVE